mgnify:CR=1 FL=1
MSSQHQNKTQLIKNELNKIKHIEPGRINNTFVRSQLIIPVKLKLTTTQR